MREPTDAKKPTTGPDLRYSGFDQSLNIRAYRFRTAEDGRSRKDFVVSVDMRLLLEHHVNVQEVPALCLRRLAADLRVAPETDSHCLEREDLVAYTASRPDGTQRGRPRPRGFRRGSHTAGAPVPPQ